MAEWSIATDCKSVALTGYLGSNPGLSTSILRLLADHSVQAHKINFFLFHQDVFVSVDINNNDNKYVVIKLAKNFPLLLSVTNVFILVVYGRRNYGKPNEQ